MDTGMAGVLEVSHIIWGEFVYFRWSGAGVHLIQFNTGIVFTFTPCFGSRVNSGCQAPKPVSSETFQVMSVCYQIRIYAMMRSKRDDDTTALPNMLLPTPV